MVTIRSGGITFQNCALKNIKMFLPYEWPEVKSLTVECIEKDGEHLGLS